MRKMVRIVPSPEARVWNINVSSPNTFTMSGEDGLIHGPFGQEHYQDYAITREDNTDIIIRELPDKALKSLDLRAYRIMDDFTSIPNDSNSIVVYSEGINFQKMMQDEEYAKTLQKLLDKERIQQKMTMAKSANMEMGTYIGQVYQKNNRYTIGVGNPHGSQEEIFNKIALIQKRAINKDER